MAHPYHIFIWKKAPFLRLLIPVIVGVVLGFYCSPGIFLILLSGAFLFLLFILFSLMPEKIRYRFKTIQGVILFVFFIVFGSFITRQKDIRNHTEWYGNYNDTGSYIIATIQESPIEKAKSFKAVAIAGSVINKGVQRETKGKILLYFSKDSASEKLKYGDRVILSKPLNPIKNSGNPAAFDYARYCALHQLFHQAYLKENEWILLKGRKTGYWLSFIYGVREKGIAVIKKYLGDNSESSIAKALLIGYKVDLDKDLVQAYSNAGVVHLIAISGLHMGIIYVGLVWLLSFLPVIKKSRPLRIILTLVCLWFFALLTGASPSVLRAAVMFSFIVAGSAFGKRSSVYNSLAASAFLMICFNPFILWDVGFQLSYLAVLGIVIAQKPISNWLYFNNKIVTYFWQLAAVSMAAQLFTFPLCLYYFHQLPVLFIFANLISIPLATVALYGCLLLVLVSPINIAALYVGKAVFGVIWMLNQGVLFFDSIPFSVWKNVSISTVETFVLYGTLCSIVYFFLQKNKRAFKMSLVFSLVFLALKIDGSWKTHSQKKIIVYNIPTHKAIDFISRHYFQFVGDSMVMQDKLLHNYNVRPARIAFRLKENTLTSNNFYKRDDFYQFYQCKLLMIDTLVKYQSPESKIALDYIVLSKNARVKIEDLEKIFDCKKYIFDASNSLWKIGQWKKECEELHLQSHSVSEQGAFVINL
ncbi:MAG: ComEC/Rec2 family competence protein [Ginsengibacter sp.]